MSLVRVNRPIAVVLCFIMLLKLMIPVGFMPDMNALKHGIYQIVICTGIGYKEILVDANQQPVKAPDKDRTASTDAGSLCAFAGIHSAALLVGVFMLAMLWFWRGLLFRPQSSLYGSSLIAVAWPRGPPTSCI